MRLEARLKQLESILSFRKTMVDHSVSTDDIIKHMGFDPVAVRDSARSSGKSVIEAMCEMIGMEPSNFQRLLREKANLAE